MKKELMILSVIALSLFLIGFAYAENSNQNQTGDDEDNNSNDSNQASNETEDDDSDSDKEITKTLAKAYCLNSGYKYEDETCKFKDNTTCDAEKFYEGDCGEDKALYKSTKQREREREREGENEDNDKKSQINERNKLKIKEWLKNDTECPNNCTCTRSVMKCWLNGGREMTITAGNSGNVIVQIKGINVSTKVTLYKTENGTLYRVTKNNETKEVKYTPDLVRERIREKIQAKLQDEEMELDDNGDYQVKAQKRAKLFALFPVKEKIEWQVNSETGEITKTKTVWWGFLAKDEN